MEFSIWRHHFPRASPDRRLCHPEPCPEVYPFWNLQSGRTPSNWTLGRMRLFRLHKICAGRPMLRVWAALTIFCASRSCRR